MNFPFYGQTIMCVQVSAVNLVNWFIVKKKKKKKWGGQDMTPKEKKTITLKETHLDRVHNVATESRTQA